MFETTVNIDCALAERFAAASKAFNINIHDLSRALCRRMVKRKHDGLVRHRPVEYQRKALGGAWKTFHLFLPYKLYEQCVDLRKIFKRSVSWIFAEEVTLSLDEVVRELADKKNPDRNLDYYQIRYQRDASGYHYSVKMARGEGETHQKPG